MSPCTPSPATNEADYLKQEFIPFLMRQLRDARKKLKELKADGVTVQPEIDPPENEASLSRTA
jgi:hypothetical protein